MIPVVPVELKGIRFDIDFQNKVIAVPHQLNKAGHPNPSDVIMSIAEELHLIMKEVLNEDL